MTVTHKAAGFKYHATILSHMLHIVIVGRVKVPLWPSAGQNLNYSDNTTFLREYMANLLATSFPNLSRNVVQNTITRLIELAKVDYLNRKKDEMSGFKQVLRDFLVEMKVRHAGMHESDSFEGILSG